MIQKGIQKAGGYYYPSNEISAAVNQYEDLAKDLNSSVLATKSVSQRRLTRTPTFPF